MGERMAVDYFDLFTIAYSALDELRRCLELDGQRDAAISVGQAESNLRQAREHLPTSARRPPLA